MEKVLSNPECKWAKDTAAVMETYNVTEQELTGTKYQTKTLIKRAINKGFKERINEASRGKSKMEYFKDLKSEWNPGQGSKYMNELTRKQASTIYKARTRMLKIKGNYKNGHPNLVCRMCKNDEETQSHILE